MSANDDSYSQQDELFSVLKRVQKSFQIPRRLAATMPEVAQFCGFKNESDMIAGMYFYFLAFFTEPVLSLQVMKDEPDLQDQCFREAIERFQRLKNLSPDARHAAEGFGNALRQHIEKIHRLSSNSPSSSAN